jgi:transcriptional regulator with XRE-family HTH domain
MRSSRSQEGGAVNELVVGLKQTLKDEDSRYVYAETAVNPLVSAQIKALRVDRKLSQKELADLVGTKQSDISRVEKADYATWKIETLRKFARAFGVRLRISFDEFGTLPQDIRGFTEERPCPRRFEDDPVFNDRTEGQTFEMPDVASAK